MITSSMERRVDDVDACPEAAVPAAGSEAAVSEADVLSAGAQQRFPVDQSSKANSW